jgi:membrane fusion protein, macrolide-specific efflux system
MSGIFTPARRFMFPWRHSYTALLLFVGLISFLVWKFYVGKDDQAANYITADVVKADIENLVTATGILQPHDYVDVGAQVSGQLKKLYVEIGSKVTAGDLLAEIDATVYTARVNGTRAQLTNQKAQLEDKKAQLALAKIRVERQQNLQQDDATTKDSVQAAEAAYLSAQAQINVVQAQIQQTEFSLRVEEANLTYSRIYAPISGTVASITSRQGQTLNANQQAPTIMRISDLSVMTVQAQVSEADIGKLKIDMPVYFTTLGGKEYRWYSKLNRVQPTPEVTNNVVLYNALFEVANENHALMTQMSTQIFFVAAQAKDALVIPASAVNFAIPGVDEQDGKSGESKRDEKSNWKDRQQSDNKTSEKATTNTAAVSADGKSVSSADIKIDENKTITDKSDADQKTRDNNKISSEQRSESSPRRRRGSRTIAEDNLPKPATVQVVDERGNLTERKITIGISNRVQVQVIDGLQEGEKVVSGIRQSEKTATQGAAPTGAPGGPGGQNPARMMR